MRGTIHQQSNKGTKKIAVPEDVYVYRQKVIHGSKKLYPPLEINCVCRKRVNPNDTMIECPKYCGNYYHIDCMKKSPERRCTTCLTDIPLRLLAGDPVDKMRPDVIHSIQPNTRNKGDKRDIKAVKNEVSREVKGLMLGNNPAYRKPSKSLQKISKFSCDLASLSKFYQLDDFTKDRCNVEFRRGQSDSAV